jgi:hypothetical protein
MARMPCSQPMGAHAPSGAPSTPPRGPNVAVRFVGAANRRWRFRADQWQPPDFSGQPWTVGSGAARPPRGPPLYKPWPAHGELICAVRFLAEPCQIFARAPTGGNGFRRYDVNIMVLEISLLFGRRPCHPASRMGSAPHPTRLCSRRIAVRMGSAPYVRRQASWMCCRTRDGWRSLSCRPLYSLYCCVDGERSTPL